LVDSAQSDTANQLRVIVSKQQPAVRRGVVTGKTRQFFFKILKTKVDLEPVRIFTEELTGRVDVLRCPSLDQVHGSRCQKPDRQGRLLHPHEP
jgi:hypothetical protein